MAEKEWLGAWRRPGSGDDVGGQLVLDGHRIKLVLFGSVADWGSADLSLGISYPLPEAHRLEAIHGLSGTALSVLKAWCDSPLPPKASGSETWYGDAIVEAHVGSADREPLFTGVRLELSALAAWARARGVSAKYWFDGRTEVVVRPHDLGNARLPSGSAELRQAAVSGEGPDGYRIRQPVSLTIQDHVPSTWQELLNRWLQPVQVLLWIATGRVSRVENLEVLAPPRAPGIPNWAKLWVSLVEPSPSTSRDAGPHDVLFFADEPPGGFGCGFSRWLGLWNDLGHLLGPLHARASAPFAYANDRFYTAIAALEAYHRYCVDSERDLPRQQHRVRVERLDQLLAEQAPDLRTWATNAARPFNKIPLWRRIVEIADVLEELAESMFGPDIEKFARAAEATRHGHAHASSHESAIVGGEHLYVAADALVWLLRTCVMIDLGFTLLSAQKRVLKHDNFRWMTRRLARVLATLD